MLLWNQAARREENGRPGREKALWKPEPAAYRDPRRPRRLGRRWIARWATPGTVMRAVADRLVQGETQVDLAEPQRGTTHRGVDTRHQ
ncbi:hypothetical protein NDU88_003527 [Pleurodeles waltl]|uniref:Uncharacterized protein n=1 Tax=Pleurodeles waltl TaxID=8319 RepID=A0AAV7UYP0_PLEWA|nr:hypothetical protein NDU88_003527 [Pleurodeles waltl]